MTGLNGTQDLQDMPLWKFPPAFSKAEEEAFLREEMQRLHNRFDTFEERVNTRLGSLEEKVNTRLASVEDKVSTKLNAMSEQVALTANAVLRHETQLAQNSKTIQELREKGMDMRRLLLIASALAVIIPLMLLFARVAINVKLPDAFPSMERPFAQGSAP